MDVLDPASPLKVRDDGYKAGKVLVTRRIGIHEVVDLPLRFILPGNDCVSGAKSLRESARRMDTKRRSRDGL
jgi:3-methyladenine DNA glycosylase Mpg